jgi:hypothetical protein
MTYYYFRTSYYKVSLGVTLGRLVKIRNMWL